MESKPIKVRFPPSPTGYCHVGTARMAVLNFLFAKKNGGTIVFRSEDTDRERSTKEFEDDIVEQLKWLGTPWDEFSRTTELVHFHTEALKRLVDEGKAYLSEEDSKKDPGTKVTVVRLKNPGTTISFDDVIRGTITFDTSELGDFVIARAIDDPLYQFAVVEDDGRMGVTHVIRGEDHISNTPRQILIQEALGYPRPIYAHYPLLLGSDRSKLSKRTGDVAVRSYREKGFLPDALFNYIAMLGWTPPSGREVLSIDEMMGEFDLADLHKSGAVFDLEKLRWFNRQYLERMSDEAFAEYAKPSLDAALTARGLTAHENIVPKIVPILRERVHVAEDITAMVENGELSFFFQAPTPQPDRITEKKSNPMEASTHLKKAYEALERISDSDWSASTTKDAIWEYATENGRGAVLWPLRYALSGEEKSPDPFAIAAVIGKKQTLERIKNAVDILEKL